MTVIPDSELQRFSMQRWCLHLASMKCLAQQTRPPTLFIHSAELSWHSMLAFIVSDLSKKGNLSISAWDPKSIPPWGNYIYLHIYCNILYKSFMKYTETHIYICIYTTLKLGLNMPAEDVVKYWLSLLPTQCLRTGSRKGHVFFIHRDHLRLHCNSHYLIFSQKYLAFFLICWGLSEWCWEMLGSVFARNIHGWKE